MFIVKFSLLIWGIYVSEQTQLFTLPLQKVLLENFCILFSLFFTVWLKLESIKPHELMHNNCNPYWNKMRLLFPNTYIAAFAHLIVQVNNQIC